MAEGVAARLRSALPKRADCMAFLAFEDQRPVGLAICFLGFSTFSARPLLNIHDLCVRSDRQGRGIGLRLLETVEAAARREGCVRLTLEVRHDNGRAQSLYHRFGFRNPDFHGREVAADFLAKTITFDTD